jgi:hypothetical protein
MSGLGYSALIAPTFTDLVALMLLYAGFAKLRDLMGFRIIVLGYGALPSGLAAIVAIATPFAEVGLGGSLLILPARSIAAASAAAFFGIAALVIFISLAVGRVPAVCGCLSTKTGKPPTLWTVARLLTVATGLIVVAAGQGEVTYTWTGMTSPVILSVETIITWLVARRLIPIVAKTNRMARVLELRNTKRPDLEMNGIRSLDQTIGRPGATNELGG